MASSAVELQILRDTIIKDDASAEEVLAILRQYPSLRENLNMRDKSGINPLMHALMRDKITIAQLLISAGATPYDITYVPLGRNIPDSTVQKINTKMLFNLDIAQREDQEPRKSSRNPAAIAKRLAMEFVDLYWQQYDQHVASGLEGEDRQQIVSLAEREIIQDKFVADLMHLFKTIELTPLHRQEVLQALQQWEDPQLFNLHPMRHKWNKDMYVAGPGISTLRIQFSDIFPRLPSGGPLRSGRHG